MRARCTIVVFAALLIVGFIPRHAVADPSQELLKARVQAALKAYEGYWKSALQFDKDFDCERLYQWSRRILEAQQALAPNKEARLIVLKYHLDRMFELRRFTEAFAKTGEGPERDFQASRFYVLEAEIWIAQEKARK